MVKFDSGKQEIVFNLNCGFVNHFVGKIIALMNVQGVSLSDIKNVELVKTSYSDGDVELTLMNTSDKTLSVRTPKLGLINNVKEI